MFSVGILCSEGAPYNKMLVMVHRLDSYVSRIGETGCAIVRSKDAPHLKSLIKTLGWKFKVSDRLKDYEAADTCLLFQPRGRDDHPYNELALSMAEQGKSFNVVDLEVQHLEKIPKAEVPEDQGTMGNNENPYGGMYFADNPMVHREAYRGIRIRTVTPVNVFGSAEDIHTVCHQFDIQNVEPKRESTHGTSVFCVEKVLTEGQKSSNLEDDIGSIVHRYDLVAHAHKWSRIQLPSCRHGDSILRSIVYTKNNNSVVLTKVETNNSLTLELYISSLTQ